MTQPISSQRFRNAARRVTLWRRPLLVSHAKPDGDALGSLLAMRLLLRSQGADPLTLLFDTWPARYETLLYLRGSSKGLAQPRSADTHVDRSLPGDRNRACVSPSEHVSPCALDGTSMAVWGENFAESDFDQVDGVIVLDTCTYGQLRPIADWLRVTDKPKLVVDHHQTADLVADDYLIDVSVAANCVILYEWAKSVGWPIEPDVAAALFVGLATDTGWFRHANTGARALTVAAELATLGAVPHVWYERLYQREKPARLGLRAVALGSMELLAEDRLSIMTLWASAFAQTGATLADTEDIINEPLQISTVIVSVLLVEQEDGVVRVSLRSKPPMAERVADIDVAAIAESFNGGGHRRAAGARIEGNPAAVRDRLVEILLAAVSD